MSTNHYDTISYNNSNNNHMFNYGSFTMFIHYSLNWYSFPQNLAAIIVQISTAWFLLASTSVCLHEAYLDVLGLSRGETSPVEYDLSVGVPNLIRFHLLA